MKRDVSFSLLGLIMLLCLGIAAASVYYQYTYTDLQSKYEVSNETLQKTMMDYQEKEMFLDAALQNLSLSEEREDVLGGKYQKVETEKVGLQTDLAEANEAIKALNKQKEDLQSAIDKLKVEQDKLKLEKAQLKTDIEKLDIEIAELKSSVRCLYDQVKELNSTAVPCATKP